MAIATVGIVGLGEVKQVLAGADASDPFALGKLSRSLPPGAYAVGGAVLQPDLLALPLHHLSATVLIRQAILVL